MNKNEYRNLYKAKRKECTHDWIDTASSKIASLLLTEFELKNKHIHTFVSIAGKKEINTQFILQQLFTIDCKVATSITHLSPNYLEHTRIYSHTKYGIDSFGIPIPLEIEAVNEIEFDIVIVPLLCVDIKGNRIGYGKGFYDQFLAKCRKDCMLIGLSLFEPITPPFESETWDVPLGYCITPSQVLRFL